MASKTINDLDPILYTGVATDDEAVLWDSSGSVSKKITFAGLTSYFQNTAAGGSSGQLLWNNGGAIAGVSGSAVTSLGNLTLAPTAGSSGSLTALTLTGAANTGQAAGTEAPDVLFNLARTVTFATGAIATQRAVRIAAPTYAFAGASTITTAATLSISGPPAAGSLATITNPYAVLAERGVMAVRNAGTAGQEIQLFHDGNAVVKCPSNDLYLLTAVGKGVVISNGGAGGSITCDTGGNLAIRPNGTSSAAISTYFVPNGIELSSTKYLAWVNPGIAVYATLTLQSTTGVVQFNGNGGSGNSAIICGAPAAGTVGLVVKGFTSQTADLQQWQLSTGAVPIAINADGSKIVTLDQTFMIGNSNSGSGTYCVSIGSYNSMGGSFNYALGREITVGGGGTNYSVALGWKVTVGAGITKAFAFGSESTVTANYAITIGANSTASHEGTSIFGVLTRSTAAGQAAFGGYTYNPRLTLQRLEGTNTTSRDVGDIQGSWIDSTDATRTGRLTLGAYYTTTYREGIRIDASSTVVKLGFFGATAVVQPATTGTATGFTAGSGTAVNDDSTFTGGTGSTAYRISDVVLALKQLGVLAA